MCARRDWTVDGAYITIRKGLIWTKIFIQLPISKREPPRTIASHQWSRISGFIQKVMSDKLIKAKIGQSNANWQQVCRLNLGNILLWLLWWLRNVWDEERGEDSHGFSGIMYDHDIQEPTEHSDPCDICCSVVPRMVRIYFSPLFVSLRRLSFSRFQQRLHRMGAQKK